MCVFKPSITNALKYKTNQQMISLSCPTLQSNSTEIQDSLFSLLKAPPCMSDQTGATHPSSGSTLESRRAQTPQAHREGHTHQLGGSS